MILLSVLRIVLENANLPNAVLQNVVHKNVVGNVKQPDVSQSYAINDVWVAHAHSSVLLEQRRATRYVGMELPAQV